jgi:hypothetical protein
MRHIPRGAKTAKKCKADILFDSKHESINLFAKKRILGMNLSIELSSILFEIFIGHWPMIAPLKEGEIRDKASLGVSKQF